ncbi:MAG: hypothetical protein JWP89_4317 [Schlesneria sp.]|nr:hypothetical protein [Schlesneria sp.]
MDIALVPNCLLARLEQDAERRIHLNVFFSAIILFVAAVFVVHHQATLDALPHVCLAQAIGGIPCPGCGVTRSILAVLIGDLGRAWQMNPAGPLVCLAVVSQVPLRLLVLTGMVNSKLAMVTSRGMTAVILAVLILNWLRHLL